MFHTVSQLYDRSRFSAQPMIVHKYVDANDSAAILAAMRSAGVTPEAKIRKKYTPLSSLVKAVHSDFVSQKSKTETSVAPEKGLMSSQRSN